MYEDDLLLFTERQYIHPYLMYHNNYTSRAASTPLARNKADAAFFHWGRGKELRLSGSSTAIARCISQLSAQLNSFLEIQTVHAQKFVSFL